MGYSIFWSPDAKKDYITILEYLNTHWGQQEVRSFIARTEKTLHLISANPRLFVSSAKKPAVHRCVLNRQISLYIESAIRTSNCSGFGTTGWIRTTLFIKDYVKKEKR